MEPSIGVFNEVQPDWATALADNNIIKQNNVNNLNFSKMLLILTLFSILIPSTIENWLAKGIRTKQIF